ncbi:MAG TPA: hypothetical protein VGN07_06645 [Steroidobacteraceae bacterium]
MTAQFISDNPKASGDFPQRMFRVFDNPEYAKSMVEHGRFRFGNLNKYVEMEDAIRRDATEGVGERRVRGMIERIVVEREGNSISRVERVPGEMNHTYINRNAIYVCSFVAPDSHNLRDVPEKFGKYVVQIDDAERLTQDVINFRWASDKRFAQTVQCVRVIYDKGEVGDHDPEAWTLAFKQKPSHFSDEHETRLVMLSDASPGQNPPTHFDVDLGCPLPYASYIER